MAELPAPSATPQRLASLLIGLPALLEIVLVTHHPIAPRSSHGGASFGGIQAVMLTNLLFHALLMVILVGQTLGLLLFARRLGLGRPLVLVGLIFCGLASVLLTVAMTFDGFVTYELVSACSASPMGCTAATAESLHIVLATIQAFTKLGFGAQCLGFAALGTAMWLPRQPIRAFALACVAVALAPVALITAQGRLGPVQLAEILALLAVWGLCAAFVLFRGLYDPSSGTARAN